MAGNRDSDVELSVVVPINNEAQSLYRLTKEIVAALRGFHYELILVDDGSTDDTDAEVKRARKLLPDLRLLRHSRRRGQSAALWSGIRVATAPWIATLDGDGQNDPRDIKAMMSARANLKDETVKLVMGIRINRRDSRLRRIQAKIANAIRSLVLGDGTPDSGCGIKLFARDTFLAIPKFDHMHLFLPALFQREGARVISVPVRHYPRRAGRSKYGLLGSGLIDLLGLIWLRRRLVTDPTTLEISSGDEKTSHRSLDIGMGNHADDPGGGGGRP
jgi:dolichol-phosphate mannosyltransferase